MAKNIHEQRLDEIEARYPKQLTCVRCGETKSAQLFRFIVSREYAESRGYRNHMVHPMKRMSDLCDVCNPNYVTPAKIREATQRELEQHLVDNRIDRPAFDAEMQRRRRNPSADPVRSTRVDQMWKKHEARWRWLRERLLDDHRRARVDLYRHEVQLKPLSSALYALSSMLVDYTALLMRRVTECKQSKLSSTEGIPTLAQMLGERRTNALRKAWCEHGPDLTPHRYGRKRVVPFIVRNLNESAMEYAPPFASIKTGRKAEEAEHGQG